MSSAEMDIDPATAGPSRGEIAEEGVPTRIIVDVNNPDQEVETAKKPQVPQEPEKKSRVINFIAKAHHKIYLATKLDRCERNLSLGDQIHNVLFTSYNVNRQVANRTGGTLSQRLEGTDYKITFEGRDYNLGRAAIDQLVRATAIEEGVPFEHYDQNDKRNWYGIAGPILNFLSGFALRKKELRLGHHTMPIGKVGQVEKAVNLSQYGIYGCHHILCEGVTFPPEKRASMVQSLGPMTSLLCYLKSERKYSQKWLVAVKRAFAHFPDIDTVLSILKDRDSGEVRPLISLMCDIALMTTTRQAQRMFPPPAAFSLIFRTARHKVGNSIYETKNLLDTFNFSGHGAFAFYKIFQSYEWQISLNRASDSQAKQIVYHSMFGTYKEDLSLLAAITNQATWETREQMGKIFQKANTDGQTIIFKPVQQVYYAKLAQANQTGLLTSSYTQMTSLPCFSGRTKRKFSDAFFDHLTEGTKQVAGGKSLQSLIASYSMVKEELRLHLEKNNRCLVTGTTGWRKINNISVTLEPVDAEEVEFNTSGLYFLGKN